MSRPVLRYRRDLAIGFVLYAIALFASNLIADHVAMPRPLLIILALSPMLPVILVFRAIFVFAASWDELQRRIALEALLSATLVVGSGSFAWGFIEGIEGMPRLPAIWIMPSLFAAYGIALFFVARRYR